MNVNEIQDKLNSNGFPCGSADGIYGPATAEAVRRFQLAYCGPVGWLEVDGKAGPKTQEALGFLPRLSTHFTVSEAACHHCGKAYVQRELLGALEALRQRYGRPIVVLGMYRCDVHNAAVGGAGGSQHKLGNAADLSSPVLFTTAKAINRFGGIGLRGKYASHVDVRPGGLVTWNY